MPYSQFIENSRLKLSLISTITAAQIPAIFAFLKTHPEITHLDLGYTQIGNNGALLVADFLPHFPQLTHLTLIANHLGPDVALALSNALIHCPQLIHIGMKYNQCGPEALTSLRNAIKYNIMKIAIEAAKKADKEAAKEIWATFMLLKDEYLSFDSPQTKTSPPVVRYWEIMKKLDNMDVTQKLALVTRQLSDSVIPRTDMDPVFTRIFNNFK